MLIIYFFIMAAMLYVQFVYKKQNITLLIGIFLLLCVHIPSIDQFKFSLITLSQKIILNNSVLKFIAILGLLYLISELLIILGFQKLFLHYSHKVSKKVRKIYIHIFAILSTNIDNKIILDGDEYEDIYDSSSFILASLCIISVPFLTTLFFLLNIFAELDNAAHFIILLVFTNFYGLYWLGKRIIDFMCNVQLSYRYYDDRLIIKDNHAEPQGQVFKHGKSLLMRIGGYLLLSVGLGFYLNDVIMAIIGFLCAVFADLFISAEIFAFGRKDLDEKLIYVAIFNGLKKVFNDIIVIILGIIYLITAADLLIKYSPMDYRLNLVLLLGSIILAALITYFTKLYTLGLILILPIISPVFSAFFLLHSASSIAVVVVLLVSTVFMAQHFSIIKINFKDYNTNIDLLYQLFVVIICYGLFVQFTNIVVSLVALVICLVIYRLVIIKLFR